MLCFPHLTLIVFFSIAFRKNKFDVKRGKLSVEAFIKRVYINANFVKNMDIDVGTYLRDFLMTSQVCFQILLSLISLVGCA